MKLGKILLVVIAALVIGLIFVIQRTVKQYSQFESQYRSWEDVTMENLSTLKPFSFQSRLMEESEKHRFRKILERLDAAILKKAPAIHETLSEPATESEILAFRKAMGGAEIDVVEILFEWHARSSLRGGTELTFNGHYEGMERMLFRLHQSSTMPFLPKERRRSLHLFHDHAGDGLFINLSSDPPTVFYDMLESPDDPVSSGTIVEYFEFITKVWETAEIKVDPKTSMIDFDSDMYFELEEEYLSGFRNE